GVPRVGVWGVRGWRALAAGGDGGGMRGRADPPWYPGHRLFRQREAGDWGEVFGRLAGELRRLAVQRAPGSFRMEVNAGELLDRLSILQIKRERIADDAKRAHVLAEVAAIEQAQQGGAWPDGIEEL